MPHRQHALCWRKGEGMVRGMYKYRLGKCFAKILLVKHFTTSPHKFYGQNKMFSCLTKVLQQQKTYKMLKMFF